jgi:hypothetical protein
MRQTWARQQTDPDYAFDTPVPSSLTAKDQTGDRLATSIGELGPAEIRQ